MVRYLTADHFLYQAEREVATQSRTFGSDNILRLHNQSIYIALAKVLLKAGIAGCLFALKDTQSAQDRRSSADSCNQFVLFIVFHQ